MPIDYGSDTSTFAPDGSVLADYSGPEITGIRVVLENVARVIMTPIGALFWDANIGVTRTLQSLQNATLDDADLVRIAQEWGAAAKEQVDFVTSARFLLRRATDGKGIAFTGSIKTEDGVFPLLGTAGEVIRVLFPGN